jgi:hypothetical protein
MGILWMIRAPAESRLRKQVSRERYNPEVTRRVIQASSGAPQPASNTCTFRHPDGTRNPALPPPVRRTLAQFVKKPQ